MQTENRRNNNIIKIKMLKTKKLAINNNTKKKKIYVL